MCSDWSNITEYLGIVFITSFMKMTNIIVV